MIGILRLQFPYPTRARPGREYLPGGGPHSWLFDREGVIDNEGVIDLPHPIGYDEIDLERKEVQ